MVEMADEWLSSGFTFYYVDLCLFEHGIMQALSLSKIIFWVVVGAWPWVLTHSSSK
jgi:hypothetical protein